ncbi:MAG: sigma-70 family RNA polymerase sigma factor [Acidobacteria bacterium]|nr:sigma-70 family RNA polymerase sigma factor [Acidobacteriota bacterium]
MNIQEENWVALAREGDPRAMHELYERHRSRIFSLAYRYVRNIPDAEDILQDTFIKAFRSLKNRALDDDGFFSTWIYRIAVNCAMDHFRRRRHEDVDGDWQRDFLAVDETRAAPSPEREYQRHEVAFQVRRLLDGLTARKRMIVQLRHFQQLKIDEIAELLGCSQGSVKKQLFLAMAQLRVKMDARCGG